MKITTQNLAQLPYSLHDMSVIGFELHENELTLQLDGLVKIASPCEQVKGSVRFCGIDWDFCWVYVLNFIGNEGTFTGEKMTLRHFMEQWSKMRFDIIDETYSWHKARLGGWLSVGDTLKECVLEISYDRKMEYIEY